MKIWQNIKAHPTGFWFIFWGEFAERAAFYGMRTIIALFFTNIMHFDDGKAGMLASFFSAGCYLLPIVGGWIADRYLGKFWTIIIFAIPYLAGYPLLGLSNNESIMYFALFLLAMGSGVIKPNLSPLMGSMYEGKPEELRSQAFSWFYLAINIGAGITSFSTPWVREHYGYQAAFMSTACLMAIALFIFFLGKRHYPIGEVVMSYGKIVNEKKPTLKERQADNAVLIRLAGIFAVIVFFWSVYDQTMSTWVYFARDHMNLYGFQPDQPQGLNPLLIIIFTPIFNFMWPKLGIKKATTKMMIGYIITAGCMAMMAIAGSLAVGQKVSILWMVAAYAVITLAELCISVVGLELAYTEAPKHMKSTVTSVFLFTVFLGDGIAAYLASIYPVMTPGNYFWQLTIMMIGVSIIFYIVARDFERKKAEIQLDKTA